MVACRQGRTALPEGSARASPSGRLGYPSRDLCRYSGAYDLHRLLKYRLCPACWAITKGQVSGPVSTKASGDSAREPIGVFVLDDHEIVRRGVRSLLEAEPDIRVIGEADTASAALAGILALRPDVAVLDLRLPDGDGVSVCREVRVRLPRVACLMFTAFGDDEALLDSIMAGAAGYVLKEAGGSDLVSAVRAVASGRSLLHPRTASQLMARLLDSSGQPDPLAGLTPHERNVLVLIGEGLTNRQIGERLLIAEKTVKNYVSTMFRKLGLEQRTAAAAYVARIFEGRTVGSGRDLRIADRKP
jgi:DNA-binding NarL/FixJ family response regulator